MAEVVVIEISAPNVVNLYQAVNKILGWEGAPDSDHLPAGMLSHTAGESGDKLVVVEVWESQDAQAAFMQSQLAPAFAEVQVPEPTRVEWFSHLADVHRH